jgi:hypothetical protein
MVPRLGSPKSSVRANNESGASPPRGHAGTSVSNTTVASLDSRVLGPPIRVQRSLPFSREPSLPVTVALCGMGDTRRSLRYRGSACAGWLDMSRVTTLAALEDCPLTGPLSVSIARKRTRYDPCNASVRLSAVVVLWRRTVWTCPKAGRTGGLIRKKNTDVAAVGGSPHTALTGVPRHPDLGSDGDHLANDEFALGGAQRSTSLPPLGGHPGRGGSNTCDRRR